MSFQPTPKQVLVLWNLLFTGDEPKISALKPPLKANERKPLIQAGFIEIEKRGRSTHVLLTEKAWSWAANNLDAPFAKSPAANIALKGVLTALQRHLDAGGATLAELLSDISEPTPQKHLDLEEPEDEFIFEFTSDESSSPVEELPAEPEPDVDLCERVRLAYLNASGGSSNVRVRLADLYRTLSHVPKAEFDAELIRMQSKGQFGLVLWSLDDPFDIHPEDEAAAVSVAGIQRHIVYMEG